MPSQSTNTAILVFEMTWSGTVHAPGNGSTLQTMAAALPGRPIHVFAEAGHIRELQRNSALAGNPQFRFHAITIHQPYRDHPSAVSKRRLLHELATMWRGLRMVRPDGACLLMLLSATSTAIFAAAWLARLRGRTAVQVGLHGNLNEINGWRSRNPVTRALDMASAVRAAHGGILRFLVLEPGIRGALVQHAPAAALRTDVLPLPVNIAELVETPMPARTEPLRLGFVGLATQAKGIDMFLAVAAEMRARYGRRIAFHLIGRVPEEAELAAFAGLEEPAGKVHLPRDAFTRRLAAMHYVVLPYRPGYYDLAASGALIDAITWLKPVIAFRVGFVAALFETAGDIGYLCDTPEELRDTIDALLVTPDAARYARQVDALRAVRDARLPSALAHAYRAIVLRQFPQLLS